MTVYLSHKMSGKWLGTKLYSLLLQRLKESGVRMAISGITLPNASSVKLHEKLGMVKLAHFEKVGFKFNQWLDVGYWQIDLNAY
ncbi:GNAT family N-acetyltransferase [Endozoicomonas sp. ALB032]|uniref:GNAT family N-acetyltransferase n=1 Tax=Endozoicomonas sp. ALB032 TaxID=3403082 RepID=UPI003BB55F3A